MRKPGRNTRREPTLTYAVDMSTPVAAVRAGVGARAGIPSSAAKGKRPRRAFIFCLPGTPGKSLRRVREVIPEAEPIPETIPSAEPVEERIPSAEPVEDDIPLAEPVVCAGSRAVVKGGAGLRWN